MLCEKDQFVESDRVRAAARRKPSAQRVSLPDADHAPTLSAWRDIGREIERFITAAG
jgi:hypothetical protein